MGAFDQFLERLFQGGVFLMGLGTAGIGLKVALPLILRSLKNGNGNDGFNQGKMITLLEQQNDILEELRKTAESTKTLLEQNMRLLAEHDQQASQYMRAHP